MRWLTVQSGHYKQFQWAEEIKCIAIIPDFEVSTAKARGVLPTNYSRADMVFNMQRIALTVSVIIHRPTFLREYEKFWQQPADMPIMWIGLMWAIFAISRTSGESCGSVEEEPKGKVSIKSEARRHARAPATPQ